MRLRPGDSAPPFSLPSLAGSDLDITALGSRRYMISFLRFASCPLCNLRVNKLVSRFDELGEGFTIVAVFDSTIENLRRHATRHDAPFPILADADNTAYRLYGVERSWWGLFSGMIIRLPSLIRGMFFEGYLPLVIQGSMLTMPADFLVEDGVIRTAYYGKDEGDHLPIEEVIRFSRDSLGHPGSGRTFRCSA